MKNLYLILLFCFAFAATASAQDEQDKTQRQPPPVTQAQVERDARQADEVRRKHENEKNLKEGRNKADVKHESISRDAPANKASKRPGKQ